MAIVFRKDLQNTVSTVDLSQWCNNSRELQGIRLLKPDQSRPAYPYELFVFFRFIDLNTIIRFCLIIYELDP